MNTNQPIWKYLANLGDASPLEYGGFFVYEDTAGVYAPEAEYLEPPSDEMEIDNPKARWTVYRFILEPCTFIDGILSDNKYHPTHPVWFAKDLDAIAETMGMEKSELIAAFCSVNPCERAHAWRCVAEYHGYYELDQYPAHYTRTEIEARYTDGELS